MIAAELRQFWLPGINRVTGVPGQTLIGLLGGQRYQIFRPPNLTATEMHFADWDLVAAAFANEVARTAMAAVESIDAALAKPRLPRGVSWMLIKVYYAGFFASHAVQRMLGRSIIRLDATTISAIGDIADLYGMASTEPLQGGLYRMTTNATAKTMTLSKITREHSHQVLWGDTADLLRTLGSDILRTSPSGQSANFAAGKLAEVEQILTDAGSNRGGSWIPSIRNRVNYHQEFGAWFPYGGQPKYCQEFASKLARWAIEPDAISLWPARDRDLQRFLEVCLFFVSLCRALTLDMNSRCPAGRSFHHHTTMRLLGQLGAC